MFNTVIARTLRLGLYKRTDTLAYAPVGLNYVVAPGDEVKINLWGYNEIRANLVDRDGN